MKCEDCKASYEESYPESNEKDWYCLCGNEDNQREDSKGNLGCDLHYKTIEKRLNHFNKDNEEMSTDEYLRSGY